MPWCTCQTGQECLKGKYAKSTCTDKSTKHCVAMTECSKGSWAVSAGTPWANSECKKCAVCPKDSFVAKACSATADTKCQKCAGCKEQYAVKNACSATKDTVSHGQPSPAVASRFICGLHLEHVEQACFLHEVQRARQAGVVVFCGGWSVP